MVCTATVHEGTAQTNGRNLLCVMSCVVRVREVPVPIVVLRSDYFASAIKVVGMVTNRLHSFCEASLVDVIRLHVTFNFNTLDGVITMLECTVIL